MQGAFRERQIVCAVGPWGPWGCGHLGEETERGFVWDLFQCSSSVCLWPPLRKCLSGFWVGGGQAVELALGSRKPRSLGCRVEPTSTVGGALSTVSSAAFPITPSKRPESPSPRLLMRIGGLLCFSQSWNGRKSCQKGYWNQNSECSQAGRGRMNADELPLDSCAYTL